MSNAAHRQALLELLTGGEPSFVRVLEEICQRPHQEVVVETPLVPIESLTEPDTERFAELVSDPTTLSPSAEEPIHFRYEGGSYQFTQVYDARPRASHDTYPNRFTRHVARRAVDALLAAGAAGLAGRLRALIERGPLSSCSPIHRVSVDHNVLRKDPHYRVVLQTHVALTALLTPEQ